MSRLRIFSSMITTRSSSLTSASSLACSTPATASAPETPSSKLPRRPLALQKHLRRNFLLDNVRGAATWNQLQFFPLLLNKRLSFKFPLLLHKKITFFQLKYWLN
eukprot:XP_014624062.1 uncharacterized protein LOC100776811 [Glycine max]